MRLTVVGCAPAYTRRPGTLVVVATSSSTAATAIALDLGQGSFAELWRYGSFGDICGDRHQPPARRPQRRPRPAPPLGALRRTAATARRSIAPAELRRGSTRSSPTPTFLSDFAGEALRAADVRGRQPAHRGRAGDAHPRLLRVPRLAAADPTAPGLVYSGDCGRADDLLPLIRPRRHAAVRSRVRSAGVDPAGIHLTAGEAARVAREAGAGAADPDPHPRSRRTPTRVLGVAARRGSRARSSWPNRG